MTDIEKYIIARWAYSVGQPIMSDPEYNMLHRMMQVKYPTNPYSQRSWSSDPCPAAYLRKYGYSHLIKAVILSDKTESIQSLNTLVDVRSEYAAMNTPHVVSFKLDGWNVQASYYNGELVHVQTRGRSTDAMDANVIAPMLPRTIPVAGKALVTLELLVPNADFQYFKQNHNATSQRGAVSTALAKGGEALKHIKALAHGIRCSMEIPYAQKLYKLQEWGFEVPNYTTVSNFEGLNNAIDNMGKVDVNYAYPTDGLVIEGPDKVRAIRIGRWEEPIYRSYIVGYEESYGPHSIAIQMNIFPIKLKNSTQRNIPATNIARIMRYGLLPGAPVAFRVASSAIADFDEDATMILQKEWEGRWPEYHLAVEVNERLKSG